MITAPTEIHIIQPHAYEHLFSAVKCHEQGIATGIITSNGRTNFTNHTYCKDAILRKINRRLLLHSTRNINFVKLMIHFLSLVRICRAVLMLLLPGCLTFTAQAQVPVDSAAAPQHSKPGFYPEKMYFGVLYGFQPLKNTKMVQWFSEQGMGEVNRQQFGSFVFGGFLGDAAVFELRMTATARKSAVSSLQLAMGILLPVWLHKRSHLFAGLNFSHEWNQAFGIRERIPPALREDTVGLNLSLPLLNLTQNGLGVGPELRYVYHIGKEHATGVSLIAAAGFSFHALTKWKFTEGSEELRVDISKPDIPSINRLTGYYTIGLVVRIK